MRPDGRIGVLFSGRGTNLESILLAAEERRIPAVVAVAICNEPSAPGIARALARGVETLVLDHRVAADREDQDRRIVSALEEQRVDLVCLAGYMKLLTPVFLKAYPGRILNIHPALLPAFPGLHAQRQALEYGVRFTGATVHFVDAGVDTGPIVLQSAVRVEPDDTPATLAERILKEEHRIYPEAIRLYFQGRLRIEGRRVRILPPPPAEGRG